MKVDFSQPVIFDAANNGYQVTLDDGSPFEVLEVDTEASPLIDVSSLWADVQAWLADGNTAQPYPDPPDMTPPQTVAQQKTASIAAALPGILYNLMVSGTTPTDPWVAALVAALEQA